MGQLPFEKEKKEVVEKKSAETSDKWGKKPEEREFSEHISLGVINLDKPEGPTSHQVSDMVKKVLGVKKAGHSGTLDPKVTGVLPIGLDSATKVLISILGAGKEYVCLMHMHKEVPEKKVREVLKSFEGVITQLPPIKSSVKRVERQRNVYYLEILEIDEKDVLFKMGCQAGTYLRKICHDAGVALGVGANMQELRRTKAGPFSEEKDLVSLHELSEAKYLFDTEGKEQALRKCILPVERAVEHLKKMWVIDSAICSLTHGASLKVPGVAKIETKIGNGELVALFSLKGELIALANAKMTSEEILAARKGVAATLARVVMKPDTYPRMWQPSS